jgi:hypothetical protein
MVEQPKAGDPAFIPTAVGTQSVHVDFVIPREQIFGRHNESKTDQFFRAHLRSDDVAPRNARLRIKRSNQVKQRRNG